MISTHFIPPACCGVYFMCMFVGKFFNSIFFVFILFGGFLFSVGAVYAHGDEDHSGLVSEVNVCHSLSEEEKTDCYAFLCEEGMTSECAEDVVDAAMEGSGPKFATAVLYDLDDRFNVDAHALAQRMGRNLVDTGSFGDCLHDFHYGCHYGFFQESVARLGDEEAHAQLDAMIGFCGVHNVEDPVDVRLKRGKCHYQAGKIFAVVTDICESVLMGGGSEMCYHKMGHMFMKQYEHKFAPALSLCSALPSASLAHCWDGVFMENVNEFFFSQGEGGDGFLVDDPFAPCNNLAEQHREQCYKNHGRYLIDWFEGAPFDVLEACSGIDAYAEVCRHSIEDASSGADSHHTHGGEGAGSRSWFQKIIDFIVGLFSDGGSLNRAVGSSDDDRRATGEVVLPDRPSAAAEVMLPEQFVPQPVEQSDLDVVSVLSLVFPDGVSPSEVEHSAMISYENGQFVPNEVRIKPGQSVLWVNEDQVFWPAANLHPTHREYPGSDIAQCGTDGRFVIFDACEAMGPGAAYAFQFNEIGEWKFHDHINPKATGTVIVSP